MKKEIHPEYREVLFHDISVDFKVLTRSTIKTKDTIEHEGQTYPYIKVDISSASHPFYTGTQKILDSEGRVDKFKKKYARRRS
ncbi:MAG: 50S ribosomal protein L31 [Halobacteriovoraceae bacterium]|nr:50S ribosomal protein L31 [Halobacteriovoraceae bacterium]|tara:strand:- start:11686 stop:11934 length:249 start_codon:yes stop_codon:yes gene_type:complete